MPGRPLLPFWDWIRLLVTVGWSQNEALAVLGTGSGCW